MEQIFNQFIKNNNNNNSWYIRSLNVDKVIIRHLIQPPPIQKDIMNMHTFKKKTGCMNNQVDF